jgi:hypothetical protein
VPIQRRDPPTAAQSESLTSTFASVCTSAEIRESRALFSVGSLAAARAVPARRGWVGGYVAEAVGTVNGRPGEWAGMVIPPRELGALLARFGMIVGLDRIFKTLHVLAYVDRDRTGEASNGWATCKKSATAWPSTCSMAAKASWGEAYHACTTQPGPSSQGRTVCRVFVALGAPLRCCGGLLALQVIIRASAIR